MSLRLRELKAQMEIEGDVLERTAFEAQEWQKILQLPVKLDGRVLAIRDIEANFRICQIACDPQDVSLSNIVLLLDDESFVQGLSLGAPETIKAELIEQIVEHMHIDDGGFSVRNRQKVLSFWTLEQLREELRRVEAVTNLQNKPIAELREVVKQSRPIPGYPTLPTKIMVQGEMLKLNPAYIKRMDRESLKKLIRMYGADSVNSRLRGE
jgi:hypothetical protein